MRGTCSSRVYGTARQETQSLRITVGRKMCRFEESIDIVVVVVEQVLVVVEHDERSRVIVVEKERQQSL